jgi:hypothetical protein
MVSGAATTRSESYSITQQQGAKPYRQDLDEKIETLISEMQHRETAEQERQIELLEREQHAGSPRSRLWRVVTMDEKAGMVERAAQALRRLTNLRRIRGLPVDDLPPLDEMEATIARRDADARLAEAQAKADRLRAEARPQATGTGQS